MSEPDLRYAQFDERFAVMCYDGNEPEVVCETRELAQTYVDGQWSAEDYSIDPVKMITHLPELRILYEMSCTVLYPSGHVIHRALDEYKAFPGLGNGTRVALGDVHTVMNEYRPGWSVSAAGWDRREVEANFAVVLEEALSACADRAEAFAPYTDGMVVRTEDGQTLVRTIVNDRVGNDLYRMSAWIHASTRQIILDADVNPFPLTVVSGGAEA